MKIRTSFVSNSSSSSFVALGKEVNFKELEKHDLKNKKIIGFGAWLDGGQDVFDLTEEIYKYINEHIELIGNILFIEIYWEGDSGSTIKRDSLPEEFDVFSTEYDHHSSETFEMFQENYERFLKKKPMKKKVRERRQFLDHDSPTTRIHYRPVQQMEVPVQVINNGYDQNDEADETDQANEPFNARSAHIREVQRMLENRASESMESYQERNDLRLHNFLR